MTSYTLHTIPLLVEFNPIPVTMQIPFPRPNCASSPRYIKKKWHQTTTNCTVSLHRCYQLWVHADEMRAARFSQSVSQSDWKNEQSSMTQDPVEHFSDARDLSDWLTSLVTTWSWKGRLERSNRRLLITGTTIMWLHCVLIQLIPVYYFVKSAMFCCL